MVNFMQQCGWAAVPTYLVPHQSRYCCEGFTRTSIVWQEKSFISCISYIGPQLINNVVLVSGVQQSDSVIHIYVSIVFQILFPFRLLHNIEQSSLCYMVSPCWLPILFFWLHHVTCRILVPQPEFKPTPPVVSTKF